MPERSDLVATVREPAIQLMGVSECVRRGIHYCRSRVRYRKHHPIIEVVEGKVGRLLTPEELRK